MTAVSLPTRSRRRALSWPRRRRRRRRALPRRTPAHGSGHRRGRARRGVWVGADGEQLIHEGLPRVRRQPGICAEAAARASMSTTGAGQPTAPSTPCSNTCRCTMTPSAAWTGRSAWTPPSCAPTSTRPAHVKGGTGQDESGTRQIPRRTDQQAAPGHRRARPALVRAHHRRQRQRLHRLHRLPEVLQQITVARPGSGRPRTRPDRVIADKAYSSRAIRSHLRSRHIKATIPERTDQQAGRQRRGRHGGRPPAFDQAAYRRRKHRRTLLQQAQANGAPSPPATTNSPATTEPPSPWSALCYGSTLIYRTPPRQMASRFSRQLVCLNSCEGSPRGLLAALT